MKQEKLEIHIPRPLCTKAHTAASQYVLWHLVRLGLLAVSTCSPCKEGNRNFSKQLTSDADWSTSWNGLQSRNLSRKCKTEAKEAPDHITLLSLASLSFCQKEYDVSLYSSAIGLQAVFPRFDPITTGYHRWPSLPFWPLLQDTPTPSCTPKRLRPRSDAMRRSSLVSASKSPRKPLPRLPLAQVTTGSWHLCLFRGHLIYTNTVSPFTARGNFLGILQAVSLFLQGDAFRRTSVDGIFLTTMKTSSGRRT